jgi:SAM-dependent methyltransferase
VWWQRFYDELGPAVDRVFAAQQSLTETEVDFTVRLLGLRPPARVLDLACGTGRHSLALARRGFEVVGIDRSAPQLQAARAKAEAARLPVTWLEGDLRHLPPLPPADAAICFFNSWGYFPADEDNRAVLAEVRAHLRTGGGFVLDTLHADWWSRRTARPGAYVTGGAGVSEELAYDAERRLLHARWRVRLDGRVLGPYVIHQRLYRVPEIRARLQDAGFRVTGVYGGPDGSPPRPWSPRVIWVATAAAARPAAEPGRTPA